MSNLDVIFKIPLPRRGLILPLSFPQALSTEFRVHWRGGLAWSARTCLRWSPGPMNSFFTLSDPMLVGNPNLGTISLSRHQATSDALSVRVGKASTHPKKCILWPADNGSVSEVSFQWSPLPGVQRAACLLVESVEVSVCAERQHWPVSRQCSSEILSCRGPASAGSRGYPQDEWRWREKTRETSLDGAKSQDERHQWEREWKRERERERQKERDQTGGMQQSLANLYFLP